jgi:hypothetical protein
MFLEQSQNNKQIINFVPLNLFKSRDIQKKSVSSILRVAESDHEAHFKRITVKLYGR